MTAIIQKSPLNIVMGAMTFGAPGKEGARVHDIKDVEEILDAFRSHGHTEIDTARVYAGGTSEEYLGKINLASKGLKIETKLAPRPDAPGDKRIVHDEEGLRRHLKNSLEALNVKTLEMWYLHAPDRSVPYEVTLKAVNDLYKEGYFKRFGISNYAAWEVAEIVGICKANGYIQPTAYQGIYNAIHRAVEPELLPCLRKFGISFYEFNPLAGGFFTGRYTSADAPVEQGSRFDPNRAQGQNYRNRYWKEPYFKALASIQPVADKYNLTLAEIALRWISHHSLLKREYNDAVLIGASSLKHIKENLIDLEKGPLPEEVLKVLDDAWIQVQPHASSYFKL
ncbi:Aldo/keto reductase [Panaeolus papilionaceus]|nr:Aldo/keto reductase [Panaeolus papilionaceus]